MHIKLSSTNPSKQGLCVIVSKLYAYLNEGDQFCECYSCLKMVIQDHLHISFLRIFFIKVYHLKNSMYI